MNEALPEGAVHYATSRFNEHTLPEKLRTHHSTKAGSGGSWRFKAGSCCFAVKARRTC
ncbi:hypothetical protein [Leisingera sp. NJS201]|uniref:hypothetical protein n=1 Tax=Leisingera sp. NJS201 TaxID=2508306 RepID=UPI0020C822A8|nr:hypothetical protein [Leisingera sp. NJS201]